MKTRMLFVLPLLIAACGENKSSVSVLAAGQTFKQATTSVNNKVDLLWVVDNSGSMLPLQQNMTTNFNAFMSEFITKGLDFHMAVTTTDAYKSETFFGGNANYAKFKDGLG